MTMKSKRKIVVGVVLILFAAFFSAPVLAQGGDQTSNAAPQALTVFTRYPVQEIALGETVNFNLTLRGGKAAQIVNLDTQDLPEGWTATFRGGGDVIRAAYVEPDNDTTVDMRVEPPANVEAGSYSFTVVAQGDGEQAKLPIELVVKEKLPPRLTLSTDLPTLRGAPDSTLRYNVTLKNEGDEDLTVNLVADAPQGFQVTFKLSGQDVTSLPIAANETKKLSVEVKPFGDLPADTYQLKVLAQSSEVQAETDLTAEVTGQSDLTVTAPDGRLSGQAYAGEQTPLKLTVQNNGSAPAHNITLTASPPNGWKVELDPKNIAELGAGKQLEVTANVQPAEQALAGDYMVTMRAQPEEGAAKSADFRITVLTSTMWGAAGVGLIGVAVVVVGLAVMRFGRR
jgi:uncharacterized membrane protein